VAVSADDGLLFGYFVLIAESALRSFCYLCLVMHAHSLKSYRHFCCQKIVIISHFTRLQKLEHFSSWLNSGIDVFNSSD